MTLLQRLHRDGIRLVTRELAAGVQPFPELDESLGLVDAFERRVELDAFDAAVDRLIAEFARHDTAMDAAAAPVIHGALPLSRREAASPEVFRFLTVVHRPDFVRHRWENRVWSSMKSRFWNTGTRHDSNAIYRLWWIAELTRLGSDYSLTERVLFRPQLATTIFVRKLSWHRPAVAACVAALDDASTSVVEATMLRLTKSLSVQLLELMDEATLTTLIVSHRRFIEGRST